ncbi:helix-turn-helix domain-containing protein [Wenxinia saemankumensis]|uniref:Protein RodZ, contains Xre-like HTH and DUF4115 domains n=1 Tax=Wenxinia saemankumensis TaxID=1447782 RepID=A0A1M6GPR4_9RHOB|nr:helix-turn-helix domain-containing protein [Wenxinia saemankumensis]SHJ11830.1 protein RodZ, contains Xre-like HTH and DUF4115 domains [Wenxinia saemankumensis]
MIGRTPRRDGATGDGDAGSRGFDAFELRLGDVMRGERATMGKSLLDVQRELKIKAAYIAAIENCDPTAFDTPGFIAGYVRSYARYLGMDPDQAFAGFCAESGFAPAHGMSPSASPRPARPAPVEDGGRDIFASSVTPFIPAGESLFSGIEPRAIGSIAVLAALIGGLGWGGWSVLQEVQKVQLAPVEQAPAVVAEVDPLAGGGARAEAPELQVAAISPAPSAEALDRLYRPEALDVPVLVSRDGPIAALSPSEIGALVGGGSIGIDTQPTRPGAAQVAGADGATLPEAALPDALDLALAQARQDGAEGPVAPSMPQVRGDVPEMVIVAVRPTWVRVRSSDGTTLFEKIMDAGETWEVPATEEPAQLRTGEAGALYFAVNGQHYGPAGPRGTISNVALAPEGVTGEFSVADLNRDDDLAEYVRYAQAQMLPAPEAED